MTVKTFLRDKSPGLNELLILSYSRKGLYSPSPAFLPESATALPCQSRGLAFFALSCYTTKYISTK